MLLGIYALAEDSINKSNISLSAWLVMATATFCSIYVMQLMYSNEQENKL